MSTRCKKTFGRELFVPRKLSSSRGRWECDTPTRLAIYVSHTFFIDGNDEICEGGEERCAAVDDNKNPFSSLALCLWGVEGLNFYFRYRITLGALFSLLTYDNNHDLSRVDWLDVRLTCNWIILLFALLVSAGWLWVIFRYSIWYRFTTSRSKLLTC